MDKDSDKQDHRKPASLEADSDGQKSEYPSAQSLSSNPYKVRPTLRLASNKPREKSKASSRRDHKLGSAIADASLQPDNKAMDAVSNTDQVSDEPTGRNRRRQHRRSVLWPARLVVGRHEFACQIWNLSLGGARIRCDLPLRVGSPVTLSVAGKRALDAHVSWSEGDSLGLSFVDDDNTIKRVFEDRLLPLGLLGDHD